MRATLERGAGPALQIFARLNANATAADAQAELQGSLRDTPALQADVRPYLDARLKEDRESSEVLILHSINFVFVLLLGICGANVATLVFARTATRESEITVRTALGATRGRITAQLFAEALVLSSVGVGGGLLIARSIGDWLTLKFVETSGQPRPFWWNAALSVETFLYAAVLGVLAALIIGVTPALKATGRDLQGRLRAAGAGSPAMRFGGIWTGVIVVQTALTVIFLAAVVSLGWGVYRGAHAADVSYPPEQILLAEIGGGETAGSAEEYRRLRAESVQALVRGLTNAPGVTGVTYATSLPGTKFERSFVEIPGGSDRRWTASARVGLNFFETVGTSIVAGRSFTPAEVLGGHPIAIVDEAFARSRFGGGNPIGEVIRVAGDERAGHGTWHHIVGVVKNVKTGTRNGEYSATLYVPAPPSTSRLRLVVRTAGPAVALSDRLERAALVAAPTVRLDDVITAHESAELSGAAAWVTLRALTVTAAVALLLSTAGIYALVSFTLSRRTREIGVRAALGAAPQRIITSVFSRAFAQVTLGGLAGVAPATAVALVLLGDAAMPTPAAIAVSLAVVVFVLFVAVLSCAVLLRRALHIDPMQALRADG